MRHLFLTALLLVAGSWIAGAQPFQLDRDTSIAVFRSNVRLSNAWSPGINSSSMGTIDLNGDGRLDLVHYDAPAMRLNTFINNGQAGLNAYTYAPEYVSRFPAEVEGWIITYDYDSDGDMDLFTYNTGGIALYANQFSTSAGLQFGMVTNQIQTRYGGFQTNIYASRVNAPAISDLDNDGDMDVLAFSISGSWVEHHRNYGIDSLSSPTALLFDNIPMCWGYFILANTGNVAQLPPVLPTCPLYPANPARRSDSEAEKLNYSSTPDAQARQIRHAGSSLLVVDLDGDGDKDVLNGDILGNNVLFLENCGTPDSAWICSQDSAFPSYDVPVSMEDMASPHYFDADNDGNKDFIVGSFYFSSEDHENMKLYRNVTNNTTNVFDFVTDRWLVDGMIDVGTGAHPVFFDVDQDGRKDLLVANDFYYNGGSPIAKIAYYRNTGSGGMSEYSWVTDDFAGISSSGLLALFPAFGDVDGDGDSDMLLGESTGHLVLYQNVAGAGNPCVFVLTQVNYQSIDIGDNATPQLVDVDRDGLLDLLIGERSGTLNYYRNTGTAGFPVFSFITSSFGGVSVVKTGAFAGFSVPVLFDSGNGYELIVGSLSGYLYHFTGIDGNLGGSFTLADSIYQGIFEPMNASPAMHDVNGDGRFDLVVGTYSGGVVLYTQQLVSGTVDGMNAQGPYFDLFPNPARNEIAIRLSSLPFERPVFEVRDVLGALRESGVIHRVSTQIDISSLPPGFYVCRLLSGNRMFSRTFVKY